MRCGRLLTWAAALLLALGLAVMPAAAEIVLADTQDPYEYSYTWRVIDEGGDWLGGCAYGGRGPP